MCVQIDRDPLSIVGYRIKLKYDRTVVIANDEAEIIVALQHYYATDPEHDKRDPATCPLCRIRNAKAKKLGIPV